MSANPRETRTTDIANVVAPKTKTRPQCSFLLITERASTDPSRDHFGMTTVSVTWMTPLVQSMSVAVTS
jgi:hypothetical protein